MRRFGLPGAMVAAVALGAAPAVHAGVLSQGVFRMGADVLWSSGDTGAGQVVAIVDEGFGGLDASIAAGEMPPREVLTMRSFDARHGLDGRNRLGLPTEHGTRMAEIVHDVAPDARLVLVNYNTVAEFALAAEWVTAQGIPVVSHSNSFLDGPFDGSGPAAGAVDRAAAGGVLWVNSSGNFAMRHWSGTAPAGTPVPVGITTVGGTWIQLHLSWRDPSASASFTVEHRGPDGTWTAVAASGPSGPVSAAVAAFPAADDGAYRAVVRQDAGTPQLLELVSGSANLEGAVADGSVLTPGDARGSLTVGAVPWQSGTLAPYSSRGPTEDGRAKPDISGPTYVTANPGYPGTAGTSAATAHVAGAAVLLRARREAAGLPAAAGDIRQALVAGALDLGPAGPDTGYGAGMVRLDLSAPRLEARYVPSRSVLRVRATDDGTLDAVEVRVPGARTRVLRRAVVNLRLRPARATRVTVVARDLAGNRTTRVVRIRGAR
ncbi:MAG: S8 family serine peptidase [Thermoleophilia bacterium]|nr:S8 family serine peptidase [Thermoleophilia bacterium]